MYLSTLQVEAPFSADLKGSSPGPRPDKENHKKQNIKNRSIYENYIIYSVIFSLQHFKINTPIQRIYRGMKAVFKHRGVIYVCSSPFL